MPRKNVESTKGHIPVSAGNTNCGDICQNANPIAGKIKPSSALSGNAFTYKPRHNNSSQIPLIIATGIAIINSLAGVATKPVSGYIFTVIATIKISKPAGNQLDLLNKGLFSLNSETTPSLFNKRYGTRKHQISQ